MTKIGRIQIGEADDSAALPTAAAPPSATAISGLNLRSATTMSSASLDAIFKEKRSLRSTVSKELKSMDPAQISRRQYTRSNQESMHDAIQRIVLEAPWFKSCKRLCAYISCPALKEVDTSKILSEILKNAEKDDHLQVRKKLYVPRVENKNSFMRMLNITRMDDLIANSMAILEPDSCDSEGNEREDVMFADEPVDLFILPGLAFDKSGRRIGRGGGYYDTFLKTYQELAKDRKWKKPLYVALSYSVQILEDDVIPITPKDERRPHQCFLSPSGLIPIRPAANRMSQ